MVVRVHIKLVKYQPVTRYYMIQFFAQKTFQADFNLAVYFSIVEKIHYQFARSLHRTHASNPEIGA